VLIQEAEACAMAPELAVSTCKEPCIFVGDGAILYKEKIKNMVGEFASFASMFNSVIRASTVAELGIKKLNIEKGYDPKSLIPYYIRSSDAEKKTGRNPSC
jgi:tRNA A37 threonylcarbamoyladenosine modification protein TsaB